MSGNESKIPVGTNLVGKYRVVREIGRGGMAAVYEAEQLSLGKKVAVKVLASELAASTIVIERFFREARAAASVRSPYIVDVYDSGRLDDGRPFITMELLEGESLYDRMARIRLIDVETTIRVIVHTARGLVKAHSSGIVHRDLKPENIFLTKGEDGDEVCKILDFGLAKFYAPVNPEEKAAKRLTREGAVFGTPAYMSPEQVKGQGNVDHRADLWALGCMAYECLIGRPVWNMDQGVAMTFAAIATGHIPVPSHARADLPPAFDAWFAKCLERDPARRYQGAKELADAFVEAWGQRPASSASYPGFNLNTATGSNRILGSGANRTGANRAMGEGGESEPRLPPSGQEALTRPGSPSPLNGSNPSFPLVNPRASTDMPTTTSRPDVVPVKKPSALRYALGGLFLAAGIAGSVLVWFRFLGPQVLTPIVKSSATAPASGTASQVDLPPPNESKWQTTLADGQRLFSNGDVGDAQRKFKEAGEIGGAGVAPIAKWFLDQSKVPTEKGNPSGACRLTAVGRPRASTERKAERPAIAALSKGALVTWVDDHERPGVSHVFGVVVDPTGRAISPVRDLSPEAVEANRPQLASIGADRLVLLYWDEKGKEAGVRARLIDGTGNIDGNKGDSVRIGGAKAGQFWPVIANGPDGFYVVWQDDRDGKEESDLFVRHLSNELETKSNETRLTDYVTVPRARFGPPRVRYPSLAVSAGNLIIAYKLENDRDKSRSIIRMRVPISEAEKGLAPDTNPARPDRVAGDTSMVSEDKVLADAPSIACGNDGCYIAWHVDSKDGGASIAKIDPKENRVIFRKKFAPTGAHPVLASNDGVVSIAWYEKPYIKFTTLNDAGPILPATSVAHIYDVTNPRPSIAPGANKNEWYMSWTDSDVPKGQTEVYEARVTCK